MSNKNGKFESGKYHTIEITKNVGITINDERVRLGIKKKNDKGVEYPVETDYFVCPKRIREIFGEEPTELTVYFPDAHREIVFPQAYEKYGRNKAMQCQGDGEKSAQKKDQETGEWETVKCPCEHFEKSCKKVGYLRFMIPSVSIGTFFQCAVHGTVSINECNMGFYTADKTTGGRWAMIPFRMRRVAKKLKIPGTAKMKTHWVVTLEVIAGIEEIRRVMAGELLYLGQLREGSQYQLKEPGPQEGNEPIVEEETDEEEAARLEKAKADQKARIKESKKLDKRQAELKKEIEEGKHNVRTPEETKEIKVAREKKIAELETTAKAYKVFDWAGIIEVGERYGILPKGFRKSQAQTFITDHPDKYDELLGKLKTDQEISDEDIPDRKINEDDVPF